MYTYAYTCVNVHRVTDIKLNKLADKTITGTKSVFVEDKRFEIVELITQSKTYW